MPLPEKTSAVYALRPTELAKVVALLVEARQPTIVFGRPDAAKSQIAQQVAAATNREYVDVRALLLDPVDLCGIPWRDTDDRTRWAPTAFLPPSNDPGRWLINLEECPLLSRSCRRPCTSWCSTEGSANASFPRAPR